MRTLAIDPGARRVGLALSDAAGRLASPYEVLQVRSIKQAIPEILQIIKAEDVARLLVGLPLNMDGTRGKAAHAAIAFGKELGLRTGKPVLFADERLSSFAAEQKLIDRKRQGEKITRKQKKSRLDAIAAADFLQAHLDGTLPGVSGD